MKPLFKNKPLIAIVICVFVLLGAFAVYENHKVNLAHSTFENYYMFRGCTELLSRDDTSGTCKTANGQTIKIVKYQNAWYLDGDLPMHWGNFGF